MARKDNTKINNFIDQAFDTHENRILSVFGKVNEQTVDQMSSSDRREYKRAFCAMVKDYMKENNVYYGTAVKRVLNTNMFTSPEERAERFKERLTDDLLKGKKRQIKDYLGLPYRGKLNETFDVAGHKVGVRVEWDKNENAYALSFGMRTVYIYRGRHYEEEGFSVRFPSI